MKRVFAVFLVVVLLVLPVSASGEFAGRTTGEAVLGLSLGYSGVLGELPDIAGHIADVFGFISTRSISTQANYPYTGGAFIAVNTNYGSGLIVIPEDFKKGTFGFIKGTNRLINLTNSTVSGYWIMGGVTYSFQAARYSEPQYYYNLSTPNAWRTLTVSAVTDTNVQFLDETGERGVQHPYFNLESKLLIALIFIEIFVHVLGLFRRR